MGVLKLSILEETQKSEQLEQSKKDEFIKISACSCPCWAFIKEGQIVMDEIQVTASWNID